MIYQINVSMTTKAKTWPHTKTMSIDMVVEGNADMVESCSAWLSELQGQIGEVIILEGIIIGLLCSQGSRIF